MFKRLINKIKRAYKAVKRWLMFHICPKKMKKKDRKKQKKIHEEWSWYSTKGKILRVLTGVTSFKINMDPATA